MPLFNMNDFQVVYLLATQRFMLKYRLVFIGNKTGKKFSFLFIYFVFISSWNKMNILLNVFWRSLVKGRVFLTIKLNIKSCHYFPQNRTISLIAPKDFSKLTVIKSFKDPQRAAFSKEAFLGAAQRFSWSFSDQLFFKTLQYDCSVSTECM